MFFNFLFLSRSIASSFPHFWILLQDALFLPIYHQANEVGKKDYLILLFEAICTGERMPLCLRHLTGTLDTWLKFLALMWTSCDSLGKSLNCYAFISICTMGISFLALQVCCGQGYVHLWSWGLYKYPYRGTWNTHYHWWPSVSLLPYNPNPQTTCLEQIMN